MILTLGLDKFTVSPLLGLQWNKGHGACGSKFRMGVQILDFLTDDKSLEGLEVKRLFIHLRFSKP